MSDYWFLEDGYKFEDEALNEFVEVYDWDLVNSILTTLTDEVSKYIIGVRYGVKVTFLSSETYYHGSVENTGMIYSGEVLTADGLYSVTITSDNNNGTQIVEWFRD